MKLTIGRFPIRDVVFGPQTRYEKGVITVNKEEALAFLREDQHIIDVDIVIARPGDPYRIVPVKEAVEPRARTDGRTLFPGVTGKLAPCGEGLLHATQGVCVLGVGKHWGSFGDGLIDMAGEGAKYSPFSSLIHLCLVIDSDEPDQQEQQKKNQSIRSAAHRFAEYIGRTLLEHEPHHTEVYQLEPLLQRSELENPLPGVVLVMQAQSQMEELGYNDLVYGWDMNHYLPTFVHPNEILDGCLISGSFMPSSSKWSTYDMQNFALIKELYAEHGKSLNFLGVILSNLNVSLDQKERSALFVAQIAKSLGAQGAIVVEEGYGNPDADYIRCIEVLEDRGISTVGVSNECTGRDGRSQPLVVLSEKANALISTGDVSQLIELPPAKRVIGELASLSRDGLSGGWAFDEVLGPSVREDGSILLENNAMFCGDATAGHSVKEMKEY